MEGIENIINACQTKNDEAKVVEIGDDQQTTTTVCLTPVASPVQGHDRAKLKLSVKLFLFPETYQADQPPDRLVDESLASICRLLNVRQLDSLILSVQCEGVDQVLPDLQRFWSSCERHAAEDPAAADKANTIRSLGTSDLNVDQLRELYQWASVMKPASSQVNLDTCCDIPAELAAFAKEHQIQLLTHNDPAGMWC